MVDIEEKQMRKIISLFSTLTIEVNNILNDADKLYDQIIMFGDDGNLEKEDIDEGLSIMEVSRQMRTFKDAYDMAKMLSQLLKNMIY